MLFELDTSRVIIHVDMDCFYCQVEQRRLGLSEKDPLAVQQWGALIAVNYAARALGVPKMSTSKEAIEKCPEIRLVHTLTYGPGDIEPRYYVSPSRQTHKVSLATYRSASREVFDILESHQNYVCEKASIDEAYLDVTMEVESVLNREPMESLVKLFDDTELGVIIGRAEQQQNEENKQAFMRDIRILIGAKLARDLRREIREKLKFTTSAGLCFEGSVRCDLVLITNSGISFNKTLAKIGSGLHKPNNQTVILFEGVGELLRNRPLHKIKLLGGKLGLALERQFSVKTAGDVWALAMSELQEQFGSETGRWIAEITRGIDNDPVNPGRNLKSMLAAKSFAKVSNREQLNIWTETLAMELLSRVQDEYDRTKRWPKTFQFHYRSLANPNERSRSTSFPNRIACSKDPTALYPLAVCIMDEITDLLPCVRISLGAVNLSEEPAAGTASISSFFSKESDPSTKRILDVSDGAQQPSKTSKTTGKKDIRTFFGGDSNINEDLPSRVGDAEWCSRCGTYFPADTDAAVQEHQDFHVAQDLQRLQ